jgi:hypothetical protein
VEILVVPGKNFERVAWWARVNVGRVRRTVEVAGRGRFRKRTGPKRGQAKKLTILQVRRVVILNRKWLHERNCVGYNVVVGRR